MVAGEEMEKPTCSGDYNRCSYFFVRSGPNVFVKISRSKSIPLSRDSSFSASNSLLASARFIIKKSALSSGSSTPPWALLVSAEEYWIFLETERDREPDGEQAVTVFTSPNLSISKQFWGLVSDRPTPASRAVRRRRITLSSSFFSDSWT